MDHAINSGGVHEVSINHHGGDLVHLISTYIDHTLTPERRKELGQAVEQAIITAIRQFVL